MGTPAFELHLLFSCAAHCLWVGKMPLMTYSKWVFLVHVYCMGATFMHLYICSIQNHVTWPDIAISPQTNLLNPLYTLTYNVKAVTFFLNRTTNLHSIFTTPKKTGTSDKTSRLHCIRPIPWFNFWCTVYICRTNNIWRGDVGHNKISCNICDYKYTLNTGYIGQWYQQYSKSLVKAFWLVISKFWDNLQVLNKFFFYLYLESKNVIIN